jgi:hypothetical protein
MTERRKTKIGVYELRNACKKTQFAKLFPEHQALFQSYWNKPGCGNCWRSLLEAIARQTDRIEDYFGDVEIDLGLIPEPRSAGIVAANTIVMNCGVSELQGAIDRLCSQNAGAKTFSLARWKDEVTVIVNVVDVEDRGRHVVVESSVTDLSKALSDLDESLPGPKAVAPSRYEDRIVAIVTVFS